MKVTTRQDPTPNMDKQCCICRYYAEHGHDDFGLCMWPENRAFPDSTQPIVNYPRVRRSDGNACRIWILTHGGEDVQ